MTPSGALANNLGQVTDRYAYDAWGEVDHLSGSTADNPYLYVGELGYYDHWQAPALANMLHLGVRFYEPEVGRFSQPGSPYAYQPMSWWDSVKDWFWGRDKKDKDKKKEEEAQKKALLGLAKLFAKFIDECRKAQADVDHACGGKSCPIAVRDQIFAENLAATFAALPDNARNAYKTCMYAANQICAGCTQDASERQYLCFTCCQAIYQCLPKSEPYYVCLRACSEMR